MPVKVPRNQEQAAEEAYRIARLRREQQATVNNPRRTDEEAEDRARVERSREGGAG